MIIQATDTQAGRTASRYSPRLPNGSGSACDARSLLPNGWFSSSAFREMLVNAMEHGGQFDPEQTVEVSYIRTDRSLMYRIADPGRGCSLDQLPHAAISNPDDAPTQHMVYRLEQGMRAGGFGVLLARKFLDELVYNERGNKVLLIKSLNDQRH